MRRVAAVAIACGLACAAHEARAEVIDSPVILAIVGVGNAGALATSVAAIVYAVDGRAFDDPWVVGALFSSAICGATAVALAVEGFSESDGPGVGIVLALEAALTIWPAFWTVKSALSEVDPGDRFDGTVSPAEAIDPASTVGLPPVPSHFALGGHF